MLFNFVNEFVQQRNQSSSIMCPCPHGRPNKLELIKKCYESMFDFKNKIQLQMDEFFSRYDQYEVLQYNYMDFRTL